MIFYLLTFALGIILDFVNQDNSIVKSLRKIYPLWLYVFLCFGYMTGSDWRQYELSYNYIDADFHYYFGEQGFYYLFFLFHKIIPDYWITVAILKCIYLYTLIHLIKKVTPYWMSVACFMMQGSLLFILIDNPLRYMTALIFVNMAMAMVMEKKYFWGIALLIVSTAFHTSAIFLISIIPAFIASTYIIKAKKWILLGLYVIVSVLMSNAVLVESIRQSVIVHVMGIMEDMKDYSSYSVEDNSAFFTIGNIIKLFIFGMIVFTRDYICGRDDKMEKVYGMAIIGCFLERFFLMIPTGFRLMIPFGLFSMVYMLYLLKNKHVFGLVFLLYLCVTLPRMLWNEYTFIPYSNSIPYIITGHLDYGQRSSHNYAAYYERTGKVVLE